MSHTIGVTTTSYAWDVARGLPVVLQDGTNSYVYGLDLISATDGSGNQTYYTYDGLGSTTDLTDGSAVITGTYAYDVFGAATHVGSSANVWQFTGEQEDGSEGLYYLRARYYDPKIGRFLGQDPLRGSIGNPQSQNRFAYVMNNPVNLIDPSGLASEGDSAVLGRLHLPSVELEAGGRARSYLSATLSMRTRFLRAYRSIWTAFNSSLVS